jgi:hypothetical protein
MSSPAAPSFALQMVQACVAFLDEQHDNPIVHDFKVKYAKEVDVPEKQLSKGSYVDGKKSGVKVGLRVRFQQREPVDAICTVFAVGDAHEGRMWQGECALTTLTSTGPTTMKFEVQENMHGHGLHAPGLVVRPHEGPIYPKNLTGSIYGPAEFHALRGLLKWTIWRAPSIDVGRSEMYGAWRTTWITGRSFFGTAAEVASLILSYEREYGELKSES